MKYIKAFASQKSIVHIQHPTRKNSSACLWHFAVPIVSDTMPDGPLCTECEKNRDSQN